MNPATRAQIDSLTSLRGIAALSVTAHHFVYRTFPSLSAQAAAHSQYFIKSYLWVDFFFCLSGFVLAHNYGQRFRTGISRPEYRNFVVARFARIYPLHLAVILVFLAMELSHLVAGQGIGSLFTEERRLGPLLTNLLLLQAFHGLAYWNQPAWSISAEWLTYLVFPLAVPFLYRAGLRLGTVLAAASLAGLALIAEPDGSLDFAGPLSLVRCALQCGMGVLAYRAYESRPLARLGSHVPDAALPVALVGVALALNFPGPGVAAVPAFLFLLVAASEARAGLMARALASRTLIYLGTISYSIYMTHWLVRGLGLAAGRVMIGSDVAQTLSNPAATGAVVGGLLVVVALSAATYRWLEGPARSAVKRALSPRGKSVA